MDVCVVMYVDRVLVIGTISRPRSPVDGVQVQETGKKHSPTMSYSAIDDI
jgi:hypothetical protein